MGGEVTESERAVRKVFAILGVNIDEPSEVENFREDLRFGRKVRKMADHAALAAVGLLVVALAAAIWQGIVALAGKAAGH